MANIKTFVIVSAFVTTPAAQYNPPRQPLLCDGCFFDVTALEEFSIDFEAKIAVFPELFQTAGLGQPVVFTTSNLPDNLPSEHGSLALHARNLQLKLDNHLSFPTQIPHVPGLRLSVDQDLQQLSGMQIREELHINGAAGIASFHVDSPIMNLCFQLDHLPPVIARQLQGELQGDVISQQLQQAEQMVPAILEQYGLRATVDGEDVVGWKSGTEHNNHMTAASWRGTDAYLFDASTSHPALVLLGAINPRTPDEVSLALKFSNYNNSVGNQFAVRACEIETQIATQSFLATNPETRTFIASRIAAHQNRLQVLLQPQILNTRFNFIPLEIAGLMVPAESSCATELAQKPQSGSFTFQIAVCAAFSFVLGIAITRLLSKKSMTPADEYLLSA